MKNEMIGYDVYLMDQAVKAVALNMHIVEAKERKWSYRRTYLQTLVAAELKKKRSGQVTHCSYSLFERDSTLPNIP